MTRLVLWDIDGTLMNSGPVGGEVFTSAIEAATGIRPTERVAMSGKTDPQIVREFLGALALSDEVETHLPVVLAHLVDELAAQADRIAAEAVVMPGVVDVIEHLTADGGIRQSVLTGNVVDNAVVKLAAVGLDRLLDLEVGAYGSDHHDRRELVPIALSRMEELRGLPVAASQTWVVGDTANDLACARAAGARCLLVATGRYAYAELAALGPDAVRHDLSDVDDVVALLRA
jgi:phosphoglycolate phosphatase-like HAD superfamily hydrolase